MTIYIRLDNKNKEEIEGYSKVNVVKIVKTKLEAQRKWSNPMKVLKKKAEKEKKYTIGKSTRSGTQEPTIVTEVIEDIEIEIKDVPIELELVRKKIQVPCILLI